VGASPTSFCNGERARGCALIPDSNPADPGRNSGGGPDGTESPADHPESHPEQPASGQATDPSALAAAIIQLLEPELGAEGLDLLDVRVFRGGGRYQVRIYVDLPEGGINLDQCTRAARSVSLLMEEADPFPGPYVLEVSSPGIRRPLRKLEHFSAAVGQKVEIKTSPGACPGVPAKLRGVLEEIRDDKLLVLPPGAAPDEGEPRVVAVPLAAVVEANLDPGIRRPGTHQRRSSATQGRAAPGTEGPQEKGSQAPAQGRQDPQGGRIVWRSFRRRGNIKVP
jgi:ribosome maturation factor RimP